MRYKKLFPHKGDSTKSIRPNKGNFQKLKSGIVMNKKEEKEWEKSLEIANNNKWLPTKR